MTREFRPVAIVGLSALLPGSPDVEQFWRAVLTGRDLLTEVPPTHWLVADYYSPDPAAPDKTYGRRGGFLDPVDFDPMKFGIPPSSLPATDTSQLLALLVAERALADMGHGRLAGLDRDRIGVIVGTSAMELYGTMSSRMQRPVWLKALREAGVPESSAQDICDRIADHYVPWQEATFPGLLGNVVAGRIANKLDLHGTNYITDAACASSLAAISAAVNELTLGQCDLVLTGGVDTMNDVAMYTCFSKTPALSATGDCRPFSAKADGTMLGEGLVMFALKRLDDAERDGDRVYAVIRGIGTSSDGSGTAVYAPAPAGQARALRRAYAMAGYGPDSVGLVEAHGTGTAAGDLAEFTALSAVFTESSNTGRHACALGSVKSQIGHTKSAAGAAGLLKVALALHHKVLPPTIKVDEPNPELNLADGPLYLNTEARPWIQSSARPRRASVSSFGFGGSNFHVTVEEYRPRGAGERAWTLRAVPTELIVLSAGTPGKLIEQARLLAGRDGSLAGLARKSQRSFRSTEQVRLAMVAADTAALSGQLATAIDRIEADPASPFATPDGTRYDPCRPEAGSGPAFLFSGQGSQYLGMGAELAMHFPDARAAMDSAAAIPVGDLPLHRVVHPVPAFTADARAADEGRLTATEWAQPAIAVQCLAQLAVLGNLGIAPECVAGHSFGEIVALHAAGSFDAGALIRVARRRGELMRDAAAEPGAMLAVRAARDRLEAIVAGLGREDLWVANHNAPCQVVVSGTVPAIDALAEALRREDFAAVRLATSTAFHSPIVAAARDPLREFLDSVDVGAPTVQVYGNADARVYPMDPGEIRDRIADQLVRPVRFVDEVEAMYQRGIRTFVEVGPGRTLTKLVEEILGARAHLAVSLDGKGTNGVTALQSALGSLAVAGVAMDFEALWASHGPLVEEEQERASRTTVRISGANYGKPYPPPGGAAELPPPNPDSQQKGATVDKPEIFENIGDATTVSEQSAEPSAEWLRAITETQRQIVEAQETFQRTMVDSQVAFLDAVRSTFLGFDAPPAIAPKSAPGPAPVPRPAASPPAPPPMRREPVPSPNGTGPIQFEPTASPQSAPNIALPVDAPRVDTAVVPVTGVPGTGPAPDEESTVESMLLEAVAEKTGYPVDMLDGGMDIESDLGVDSIKRVEILATLRRRWPAMPDVPAAVAGRARTLGDITGLLTPSAMPGTASAACEALQPNGSGPGREETPNRTPLRRLAVRTVPERAAGLAMRGLRSGLILVVDAGTGLGQLVAERLREQGVTADVVPEVSGRPNGIVFLGGLRDLTAATDAIAVQREALQLARSVADHFESSGGVFVTVQDTGGDFGLRGAAPDRAWLGGLAALTRTAATEWPHAAVKAIDIDRGEREPGAVADAIVTELLTGGSTIDVGLATDGGRCSVRPVAVPAGGDPADLRIDHESVIVATGGGRGVTATALIAVARAHQPRLVLLGRTELMTEPDELAEVHGEARLTQLISERAMRSGQSLQPAEVRSSVARVLANREIRATMEALRAAGSPAIYRAVDVRDPAAISGVLAEARAEWGPITGLIHGAGVLADKAIAAKSDEQFDAVFGTKVIGLRNLLAALQDDPLDMLVAFSSVAARYGNPGQSDYAMANETLNQVMCAEYARGGDRLVRAIAWGPWNAGMVTPELARQFRERQVALIRPAEGAEAFRAELGILTDPGVLVIAGDQAEPAGAGRPMAGEVLITASTHPFLADHSIAGTVVLPVVLVLEWFTACARQRAPLPWVLRDIEVLRGVKLTGFESTAHPLTVTGADEAGQVRLELLGNGGVRHYRATAPLTTGAAAGAWAEPAGLQPFGKPRIYDGQVVFHGPRFQAIKRIRGISASGASAIVTGAGELGWGDGDWCTDPAAIDGALQLAVLWAEPALGAALPLAVTEFRLYRPGLLSEPGSCVVRGGETGGDQATCDVALLDADGSVRAELAGVRLVRRPA